MATVNFLYRSKRDRSHLTIRLLFRDNNKDYVLSAKTKLFVTKTYWLNYHFKKRIKDIEVSFEKSRIQNEINCIEDYILKEFNRSTFTEIDKGWLKRKIESYYNPKQKVNIPVELIHFIEFYINYRKNELRITSINKYRVIKKKLIRLEKDYKKTYQIKDIDEDFKNEFVDYQLKEGYAKNTVQKELAFIKTFCKQARFLGLEVNNQMDGLKTEKEKVEKIYLNLEELNKIESLSKLPDFFEDARDWLLISAFTGQRISDFMRFTTEVIRKEKNEEFIEFTQKKTNKIMTIPLHPKVRKVLNKRNGEFPKRLNFHSYNKQIKTICKIAKINDLINGSRLEKVKEGKGKNKYRKKDGLYKKYELITSHVGRRSFASNYYGIIPTTFLIYVTGHSSEAMFLNYVGKSNKDLALEASKYFK